MRIVVSGGGTGGHITPLLATVDALKSLDNSVEIEYIGQRGGLEQKVATAAGLSFHGISAGKFRRIQNPRVKLPIRPAEMWLNGRDAFRVLAGIAQSRRLLQEFQPDVVLAYGGFVGLPVGLAASLLHIPLIIHEADITMGLTNRVLAKRADRIAVGFPIEKYKELPKDKLVFTGNPVRREILKAHRLEGLAFFQLDEKLPVVLVTGGSSGGGTIVEAVLTALPELLKHFQVIHLTGEAHIEDVRFRVKRMRLEQADRYHCYSFLLREMGAALAVADLVVSRAGATTIAELAALGKPAVIIPNALYAGHQMANAVALARAGAIRMLPEDKLTTARLVGELNLIMQDKQLQQSMIRGLEQFAVPDADRRLAEAVMELGNQEASS